MLDKADAPKFYYCQAFHKGNIVIGIVEFLSRQDATFFFCKRGIYKTSGYEYWAYQEGHKERFKYVVREAKEEEVEELIVASDINKLERRLVESL